MFKKTIKWNKVYVLDLKIIILKGVSCSGKSTLAKKLKKEYNAEILSSDEIKIEIGFTDIKNEPIVFSEIEKRATALLKKKVSVIIDTTNLSRKKTSRWVCLAKKHNAKTICVFINPSDEQLYKNMLARQNFEWKHYHIKKIQRIITGMKDKMTVPTLCDEFDEIILINNEDKSKSKFYNKIFMDNLDLVINKPSEFLKILNDRGLLEEMIPELYRCVGLEQKNRNHTLTVYDHIVKSADNVPIKELKYVMAMMLHDIGKGYPGVKSRIGKFIEPYGKYQKGQIVKLEVLSDGYKVFKDIVPKQYINSDEENHFLDHEHYSAQLTYNILDRLGFNFSFIVEVASLVQYHMYLPYGNENSTKHKKMVEKIHSDLLIIRQADLLGK